MILLFPSPKYFGIERKINKLKKLLAGLSDSIKNPFSTLCGEYFLFFAYHSSRNINLKNVINSTSYSVRNYQNIKHFIWGKLPEHERNFTNVFWSEQNK